MRRAGRREGGGGILTAQPRSAGKRCSGVYCILSDTMCLSISLRKSTPPPKCQLDISISNSKQYVNDFVGDFDLLKLINRYIL